MVDFTGTPLACTETFVELKAIAGSTNPITRSPASDSTGVTAMTGFRLYWPELPRLTTDLQASKSSTTSATLSAATSMSTFSLMPDCCPLGVVSAVSALPVGTTELASGLLPVLGASTSRICVYLPAGSAVWPSSSSTPFVRLSRSTRLAGLSTTSDQPLSASTAPELWCTRTRSIVMLTAS